MSRTTILADDALLDELREIAAEEGISLGEVIRQGLEWRAKTRRRVPSFIGKLPLPTQLPSGPPASIARNDEQLIQQYVHEKHDRIRAERAANHRTRP